MKIYGKSRFDKNIYDKINKGADAIELHLDEEFVLNPEIWNDQYIKEVNISAVHVPLLAGNDVYIEEVTSRQILKWTCEFANKIANSQHHRVIVVMHCGISAWRLQKLGVFNDVVEFVRELIETNTNIEIAIENVTRFNTEIPKLIMFDNVDFHASIQMASAINHPRVGTCLDICHAMIDIALMNAVSQHLNGEDYYVNSELIFGLEEFFKANQDTIKLIHLSNCKSHGMRNDHGLPYLSDDIDKLQSILKLYKKYNYRCPITLEVKESDYSDGQNFLSTYNTLKSILCL